MLIGLTVALAVCAAAGLFLLGQDASFEEEPTSNGVSSFVADSEPVSDVSSTADSSTSNEGSSAILSPMELSPSGELLSAEQTGTEAVLTYGKTFSADAKTMEQLAELLRGYSRPAAFFALHPDGNVAISYNADRFFSAASAVKAPYAYMCYSQIRDELADFSETLIYQKSDYIGGTGILKNQAAGGRYSLKELLYYCLHYSDNIAYRMLTERFGTDEYNAWLDELGIEGLHIQAGSLWPEMTARELAAVWQQIYEFEDTDSGVRDEMLDVLTNARTNLIGQSLSGKTVAHKGGWMVGAYHDAGIVFGEEPYLLVVLTESDGESVDAVFMQKLIQMLDTILCDE